MLVGAREMQLEMQYGTKGNNCMPYEGEMFRQKQIPFGNEHCMQRRRVRAVALPLGAGGIGWR